MRVLVSGGGTAGHIHPALSVASRLGSESGVDVAFVGTPDGPESRSAREAGLEYVELPARGFDRGSWLSMVPAAWTTVVSFVRALGIIGRHRPDVIVGFGGYVALPLGLAAVARRVPLVLHEQNSVPGLTNRVLSRWARAVAVTYETSIERLARSDRAVVTGDPVRGSVLKADRVSGRSALDLHSAALVLLVFGGSRGARHVNRAVAALGERLLGVPGVVVLHIAGRQEYADVVSRITEAGIDTARYRVLEWLDDMGSALASADVVISRAGATSIAEITAIGRAAVLIPYPYATDDHQTSNARTVQEAGGAIVVADGDLDGPGFAEAVIGLLDNRAAREKMASASAALGVPDAAALVADVVRAHAANATGTQHGGHE